MFVEQKNKTGWDQVHGLSFAPRGSGLPCLGGHYISQMLGLHWGWMKSYGVCLGESLYGQQNKNRLYILNGKLEAYKRELIIYGMVWLQFLDGELYPYNERELDIY